MAYGRYTRIINSIHRCNQYVLWHAVHGRDSGVEERQLEAVSEAASGSTWIRQWFLTVVTTPALAGRPFHSAPDSSTAVDVDTPCKDHSASSASTKADGLDHTSPARVIVLARIASAPVLDSGYSYIHTLALM